MRPNEITKDFALAVMRALVGGRSPQHGDTILFQVGGEDRNLGFIYGPTIITSGEENPTDGSAPPSPPSLTWAGIIGKPESFPVEAHIHESNLNVIFHGDDSSIPRVAGYVSTLWVGVANPMNSTDRDFWVNLTVPF